MLLLPTFTDSTAYSYTIGLGGTEYLLRYTYSERADSWYLAVELPDGDVLARVRIVVNLPLLRRFTDDSRLPDGALVALDMSEPPTDPGRGDLGDRVRMAYFGPDELDAATSTDTSISIEYV